MTTIRYDPGLPGMDFSGHAGAGPRGGDPVCAALSILLYTLAESPGVRARFGDGRARLRGGDPAVYETVARGLRLLAHSEPEHVRWEETQHEP